MANNTTSNSPGKGRRGLALFAGALVFYVGFVIIWFLPYYLSQLQFFPATLNDPMSYGGLLITFVGTWILSRLCIWVAGLISFNFNRLWLLLLVAVPLFLLATGTLLLTWGFPWEIKLSFLCNFVAVAFALGLTFSPLMTSRRVTS